MKHQVFDSTAKHMMDDRVFYLDLIKIVSMFFVLLIHMFSFVLTTGQYFDDIVLDEDLSELV